MSCTQFGPLTRGGPMYARSFGMSMTIFGLVAALLLIAGPKGSAQGKDERPKPLPENVVKAWKEAGAIVGWTRQNSGFLYHTDVNEAKPDDLPGFRFDKWTDGVLVKLPDPGVPFSLHLGVTR